MPLPPNHPRIRNNNNNDDENRVGASSEIGCEAGPGVTGPYYTLVNTGGGGKIRLSRRRSYVTISPRGHESGAFPLADLTRRIFIFIYTYIIYWKTEIHFQDVLLNLHYEK